MYPDRLYPNANTAQCDSLIGGQTRSVAQAEAGKADRSSLVSGELARLASELADLDALLVEFARRVEPGLSPVGPTVPGHGPECKPSPNQVVSPVAETIRSNVSHVIRLGFVVRGLIERVEL